MERVGEILSTASAGRVSVRVDDGVLDLPVLRDYSPTVGDLALVLLAGNGGGFVIGSLGTAPAPPSVVDESEDRPPADDPTSSKPHFGSDVFRPISTGSYRNGSWRGDTIDLYQGDWSGRGDNKGAAFYGNGPHGLRGATCTRVRVKLRRESGGVYGGQAPTLRLITEKRRSGAPNSTASTAGPSLAVGSSRTFVLPDSWGQALIDGTSGGIGIWPAGSSPYVRLNGPSMALLIDWRRD